MFCIGICDDDEGLCGELEKMLYDYGKEHRIQMNIDIWYQGESLCRFLRENKKILDVLFLDIELLTTNGIEVGRFIREEQENMETAIVYISANSSYAMDLFRVQPKDFLIKPLDKIKVGNVMDRIQKISEVSEKATGRACVEGKRVNVCVDNYIKHESFAYIYNLSLYEVVLLDRY